MREKNVFENWVEQDITFMPTYRLVRGAFDDEGKRVYNDEVCDSDWLIIDS